MTDVALVLRTAEALARAGQTDAAEKLCREALTRDPGQTPIASLLAQFLFDAGLADQARGDWAAAESHFREAILLDPVHADAEARLAVTLQALGRSAESLQHYARSIELQPFHAQAEYNWGTALWSLDRKADAVEHFEAAVRLRPDYTAAHLNLGAAYQERGDASQALAHYDRVLQLEPDAAEAHHNRGLILLRQGKLSAGWPEYEWRLRLTDYPVQRFAEPAWDGSPLAGQTLLVHAEQGLGDTLQFIRYLPAVKARCANVVVQVQSAVAPLLQRSGLADVVGRGDPLPVFDFQIPLLSLPGLLGTTLETIPAAVPYLAPDAELAEKWRGRLAPISGLRVGIAWQGSPTHVHDRWRSIPLATFAILARVPGVTLVSLQKQDGTNQLDEAPFPVHQLGGEWDAEAPFVDTAAVMPALDLVVTADTALAHLAGALAVPVWVALSTKSDWRWLSEREDSPWYPTVRLFRQRATDDWTEAFGRIAEAIRELSQR